MKKDFMGPAVVFVASSLASHTCTVKSMAAGVSNAKSISKYKRD